MPQHEPQHFRYIFCHNHLRDDLYYSWSDTFVHHCNFVFVIDIEWVNCCSKCLKGYWTFVCNCSFVSHLSGKNLGSRFGWLITINGINTVIGNSVVSTILEVTETVVVLILCTHTSRVSSTCFDATIKWVGLWTTIISSWPIETVGDATHLSINCLRSRWTLLWSTWLSSWCRRDSRRPW